MKGITAIVARTYGILLKLYPRSFRNEFEEQMLLDFMEMSLDAEAKGRLAYLLFFLRELIDYPVSIMKAYWEAGNISQVLRSPPARMGVRSALGFGLAFAGITFVTWQVSSWVYVTFDAVSQAWSVWYYDTFRTENGIFLFHDILAFVSSAANSLIFGLLFALLIGRRSTYRMYMVAGALGWFIPDTVSYVLSGAFGWSVYLTERQGWVLGVCTFILTGTFWGAICSALNNENKSFLRFLVAAAILYPMSTLLFIKLLFVLWLEITPWFFFALLTFILILIGSVFAVIINNERKIPWMVIAGAIGYPVLFYATFYFAYDILLFPQPDLGTSFPLELFIVYQYYYIGFEAIFGLVFGLLLGLILGFQKKIFHPPFATN